MFRTQLTLRRGVPILAVLALAAASCGDGDDSGASGGETSDAVAALTAAASTTLDETSMSFDLGFRIEGPDVRQSGTLGGTGEFETNRGSVTTTSDGTPEYWAVFDGDEFWLAAFGTLTWSPLPDGKEWAHGSLADLDDRAAISRLEPPAILYLLNGAEAVSSEPGEKSTRYEFDVDMTAAADSAPSDRREEVEALIDTGDVEPIVHGEAVVDADGYVRELAFSGNDGQHPTVAVTWRARFDDFGDAVTPEIPPDADVIALDAVPELRDQLLLG
jgi:hypothetical protein